MRRALKILTRRAIASIERGNPTHWCVDGLSFSARELATALGNATKFEVSLLKPVALPSDLFDVQKAVKASMLGAIHRAIDRLTGVEAKTCRALLYSPHAKEWCWWTVRNYHDIKGAFTPAGMNALRDIRACHLGTTQHAIFELSRRHDLSKDLIQNLTQQLGA